MGVDFSESRAILSTTLQRHFGIDTRALAVFRVSLASVIVLDLLSRARNLAVLYSDEGLFPVAVLREQYPVAVQFSVHALSGAVWYQAVLFAVAIACAILLVIGYRTRIATVLCLYFLASVHIRNPHVLSGGDALLQHLLFWSLFLPLGERWSVDARRRKETRNRILSVTTVALLGQLLLVYGVNAVLKLQSDIWLSGTAVETVFRVDRYTEWLGPLVATSPVVLQAVNWGWLFLLAAAPLLVVFTDRLRVVLAGAFVSAHFGMFLTMQLGIFPLVAIVALVPFFPGQFWNWVDRTTADLGVRVAATSLLDTIASTTPTVEPPSPPAIRRLVRRGAGLVVVLVFTTLVVVNAVAVGFIPPPPAPADDVVSGEYSDSRWTLFAPNPPQNERWITVSGEVESGERVDVLDESPLRWRDPADNRATYSTARMRKYASNLGPDPALRTALAVYLCERWDHNNSRTLESLSIATVSRPPDTQSDQTVTRATLVTHTCDP